ncbi:MAG: hypothetical protein IV113_22165, partial [Hydrogenophaga sp.]|nr:hypothetical protein [Hydrogenophaga sp.]
SLKEQASRLTEVIKIFRIDSAQAYSAPAAVAVSKPANTFKPVAHKPTSLKPVGPKSTSPKAAAPLVATVVTPIEAAKRLPAPAPVARPAPVVRQAVAAGEEGDWESF